MKTLSVTEARKDLSGVVSRAEGGESVMLIKNSKPAAAIVSAEIGELAPILMALMREYGISLEMSRDPDVLEAFRRGQAELERGEVVWEEI
jgi:prevent-host-death family protein